MPELLLYLTIKASSYLLTYNFQEVQIIKADQYKVMLTIE